MDRFSVMKMEADSWPKNLNPAHKTLRKPLDDISDAMTMFLYTQWF